MGAKHLALTCVLLGVLVCSNAGAEQCISKAAEEALACDGASKAPARRKPHVFTPPMAEAPKKPSKLGVPAPPADVTSATPRAAHRYRDIERKLLMQEIANVTRLLASTSDDAPDHPRVLRRLAEAYVELESSLQREQIEKEMFADEIRKINRARSKKYRDNAKELATRVAGARQRAIRYYQALDQKHPDYCRRPNAKNPDDRGCGDEVLYYLAYELEQARRLDEARDVYLKLIDRHADSRYVPHAYLAFGELFFDEAQGDPAKWPLARQAYEKVIAYPAPKNALWGYAHYKLGYVRWNLGAYGEAIDHFARVIQFGKQYPQLPNASGLTNAARRDIVPVYALAGDPAKAWRFFTALSGNDRGVNDTVTMVEALGRTLMDTGHYREAIVVYRDVLMKNDAGERRCGYHAYVAKATMALESGKLQPVIDVLDEQYALYLAARDGDGDATTRQQCANLTAELLAETAMAWHLEAVGSGGVRGSGDDKTMDAAERLYELVSTGFDEAQFAAFRFPRIAKQDWPTLASVRYAWGDLLFHRGKWAACGAAFDAAYDANPKHRDAAEALFTAAECWQKNAIERYRGDSYRIVHGSNEPLVPRKLEPDEQVMMRAFDRYACNIQPPKGDADAIAQYGEILYARARTWFAAGHYDKAALGFRQLAMELPAFDGSSFAAQFYLASLEIMRKQGKRPSCVDTMQEDVPALVKIHCGTADRRSDNAAACQELSRVETGLTRIVAEGRVAQGRFAEACDLYLDAWKHKGERACNARQDDCKGYEEVLYNAARACQAGRLLAKSISIRKILVDEQYGLHQTEPAKKAVYEIGANYQAIAVYDESASWYERYARESPKADLAAVALSDAVVLRLGLGQSDQALEDARKFSELFGERKPQQASQIAFAIGAHHVERGAWIEAERTLREALPQVERHATADVKVQAHALLGRVYAQLEKRAQADAHYDRARKAGDDLAAVDAAIRTIDEPEPRLRRRFAKALESVGEAHFYFAEQERAKADALVFPRYRGDRTEQDVDRFVKNDIAAWMKKKKPAIDRATAAYRKVIDLNGGKPPPRWAIAAGAAVGKMWGDLVEAFIDAPYPSQWDQEGHVPNSQPPTLWHELRAAYKAGLADAVKPYRRFAKSVYDDCLEYGILFQYFDGELRSCEQWLSKNYPQEYHLVDELKDAPSRVSSGLAERPSVLSLDGEPVHNRRYKAK